VANHKSNHEIVRSDGRQEKPDLHCLAKFEYCAGNLNLFVTETKMFDKNVLIKILYGV
jgi:hypothetical protein